MAYVTLEYYTDTFGGSFTDTRVTERLLDASSDIVDGLVTHPITAVTTRVQRAVCYETELLLSQGGLDAISGLAIVTAGLSRSETTEKVSSNREPLPTFGGIPVSPITISLLRSDGLLVRGAAEPDATAGGGA